MEIKAIQDYYPDDVAHCYGCGKLNEHGHQIKTFWDGDETVTRFRPQPFHTAIPGFVYGGLLASLVDGVLLVVRAGHTKRDYEKAAKERLERVNARLVGAVLTNAQVDGALRYS